MIKLYCVYVPTTTYERGHSVFDLDPFCVDPIFKIKMSKGYQILTKNRMYTFYFLRRMDLGQTCYTSLGQCKKFIRFADPI